MASNADRSRAKRIRAKGGRVTPAERAWLHRYEDERKHDKMRSQTVASAPPPTPTPDVAQAEVPPAPQISEPTTPAGDVPIPEAKEEIAPEVPAAAGEPPPGPDQPGEAIHAITVPANTCGDPDCPCSLMEGTRVCKATGRRVWPKMDAKTGEHLARGVMTGLGRLICFVCRLFGKMIEFVEPTDAECKYLGDAIVVVQHRRLNGAGQYGDLLMLAMGIGGYGMRYGGV
jgi:hypothetical protein